MTVEEEAPSESCIEGSCVRASVGKGDDAKLSRGTVKMDVGELTAAICLPCVGNRGCSGFDAPVGVVVLFVLGIHLDEDRLVDLRKRAFVSTVPESGNRCYPQRWEGGMADFNGKAKQVYGARTSHSRAVRSTRPSFPRQIDRRVEG